MPRSPVKPKAKKALQEASADQADFAPHEFLRQVAKGEMELTETVMYRGKSIKIKRKPTFAERLYAAKECAPYFVPKLSPKMADGADPQGVAAKLRDFYAAARKATDGEEV